MQLHAPILSQRFFQDDPVTVAKSLLGKYLVREYKNTLLVGKIVETEAYLPAGDSAAHNYNGKTKRNESLYKKGGHAYVHTMRQYCLVDVVVGKENSPGSVLIRALEPIEGVEVMKKLRNEDVVEKLTNGPGKVCQGLAITLECDGVDLTDEAGGLYICSNKKENIKNIASSPRIGISKAKDMPLRFFLVDNMHVSKSKIKSKTN